MAKVKSPTIEVGGVTWLRIPIRTHVIGAEDDILAVVEKYSATERREGDVFFISEKVVAVTQGRALPVGEIKIGLLARLLWRFVRKVPYGIGLRSPETMQCAINECGRARILLASVAGAAGKLIGRRGDFYRIAGVQAATIDAAGTSPLQLDCVILGPLDPEAVARRIHEATGTPTAIVDVNDIAGGWVLGASGIEDRKQIEAILDDNPLGQKDEQTPFGIIRKT